MCNKMKMCFLAIATILCVTACAHVTGSASTIKTSNDITELEKTRTMLAAYPDTKMLYLTKGGSIQSSAIVKESDPKNANKLITKDLSKDSKYTQMNAGQVKLLYANKELKVIKQVVDKQTKTNATIKTSNDITELEKTRTMLATYPDTKMLYLTKGGSIQSSAIVKESDPKKASKLITKDLSKDSKYTEMTAGQVKLLYANKELKVIKQVVDKQTKTNAKLAGTDKKTTAKASTAKTVKKGFSFGQLWHKLFN